MDIALKAGEILLCSGAEIYRVEDTITRIFRSYNVECQCFVLLTGIFITAEGNDGETLSLIRRLKGHTINLHKIELVDKINGIDNSKLKELNIDKEELKKRIENVDLNEISKLLGNNGGEILRKIKDALKKNK